MKESTPTKISGIKKLLTLSLLLGTITIIPVYVFIIHPFVVSAYSTASVDPPQFVFYEPRIAPYDLRCCGVEVKTEVTAGDRDITGRLNNANRELPSDKRKRGEERIVLTVLRIEDNVFLLPPNPPDSLMRNNRMTLSKKHTNITTEGIGEAQITATKNGRSSSMYVFRKSGLQLSNCMKGVKGNDICNMGGLAFIEDYEHFAERDVHTDTVRLNHNGTMYAVAYFPPSRDPKFKNESIIFVFNGNVDVLPVIETVRTSGSKKKIKTIFGKEIDTSGNFFVITKPGDTPGVTLTYEERVPHPIPRKYNERFGRLLEYFEFYDEDLQWTKRVNALIGKVLEERPEINEEVVIIPEEKGKFVNPVTGQINVLNQLDFGESSPGQKIFQELFLKNDRRTPNDVQLETPVKVASIEFVKDANYEDFQIEDKNDCLTKEIKAGEQCKIEFSFTPKTIGNRTANVELQSNTQTDPVIIILKGESKAEQNTIVKPSDTSVTFQPQRINSNRAVKDITLDKDGPREIEYSDVKITGDGKDSYTPDLKDCKKDNNQKCVVKVSFNPKTEGIKRAVLEVYGKRKKLNGSDGDNEPKLLTKVDLSGEGAIPQFSSGVDEVCFQRQTQVKNGSDDIRQESTIKLINTGLIPFTIDNSEIQQAQKDYIIRKVKENTCNNVQKGESCKITIAFSPKGRKLRSGELVISDKDSPATKIPIKGVGKPRNPFLRIFYKIIGYKIKPC